MTDHPRQRPDSHRRSASATANDTNNPSSSSRSLSSHPQQPPFSSSSSSSDGLPSIQTTHSFPSTTTGVTKPIGSITGHRTISGTTTLLAANQWPYSNTTTNETEEILEDPMHRHRAYTAPAEFWNSVPVAAAGANPLPTTANLTIVNTTVDDTKEKEPTATTTTTETITSTTTTTTTIAEANSNTTTNTPAAAAVVEEVEDEEIKLAMAMALAIQQNPKMTPAEIHALIGTSTLQKPNPVVSTTTTTTTTAASATNSSTSFGYSLRGKIAGIMNNTTSTSANEALDESMSPSGMRQMLPFRTKSPESTATSTATTQSKPTTILETTTTSVQLASAPNLEPVDLSSSSATVKQQPQSSSSSPPQSTMVIPTSMSPPVMTTTTTTTSISSSITPAIFSKMADVVAAATAKITDHAPTSLINTTKSLSSRSNNHDPWIIEPKPRLTGVAWKRRGGMGKYSSTSAWERRKISLVGTKLMYYLVNEDDNNNNNTPTKQNNNNDEDDEAYIPNSTATTTVASLDPGSNTTTTVLEPEAGTPRGYLDLAKEKATVHVAFGHSGAPTPFCISIKIKAETKWKLSFDRHSILMEWLAALTDVVVQTSIDASNAELLAAADPSSNTHHLDLFLPPKTKEETSSDNTAVASSTPLWMMESYKITSNYEDNTSTITMENSTSATTLEKGVTMTGIAASVTVVEDEKQHAEKRFFETLSQDLPAYDDSALNHAAVQEAAKDAAPKAWMIPEEHLLTTAGILNLALFIAHASSTTVDGFWFLVVFSNLALYLCLVEHPHWGSILERVRATPTTEQLLHHIRSFTKKQKDEHKQNNDNLEANSVMKMAKQAFVKEKYIPKAGCSAIQIKEPTDPPCNEKGEYFAGWRPMSGEILQVRSHGYSVTKAKVSSPGELYDCVAVDVFESPSRYPDMAPRVQLPEGLSDLDDGPKTWRSPDIFIISIALPTDPPKMGRSSSDGGGYTVTMYYRMKPETREILRRVTADGYDPSTEKVDDPQKSKVNAVRLLEEWIRRSPNDPSFQARFKVVPNAHNLREIGMPSWISKYNGKPFLIKRAGVTGFLHLHPELSCVEFDISLHPFPYLAKQAICFMKESYFKRILVTFGFVIEGRSDDELPECLIGLMQLCYPDPAYAIQAENFFNGTAPRSV